MDIFIAWDGDHIGREVGRASLADDVEGLRRISQNIDRGNQIWRSWVESHGGSLISMGGDEGRAQISAEYLDELPKIREQYAGAVEAAVSVGVGTRLSEADQALLGAKLQGGDRVVFYTDEVGKQIEEARKKGEKTEEAKIADEYLNKAAPAAMNADAYAGASRPSAPSVQKPVATQGEHSEGQAAADVFAEERPPAPEMTHAGRDFEEQFHGAAADQEREDTKNAMASTKNIQDIKQRLAQALMMLKQQAPLLEQLKQASPDAYAAVTGLAHAVIGLAREVQGGNAPEPMAKSEAKIVKKKHGEHGGSFAERVAGTLGEHDYADFGSGPMCRTCAPSSGSANEAEHAEIRHGSVCYNCGHGKMEKVALPAAHHHVVLPVGSQLNGKIKVQHSDGKQSWKQMQTGQIMSQDPSGHPTSSRSPNSK